MRSWPSTTTTSFVAARQCGCRSGPHNGPMTTAAAVDRLVHHSVILEMTNESVRSDQAKARQALAADEIATP